MDLEQIDQSQYDAQRLSRLGFMNLSHWEEFKDHAANGLAKFGDHFLVTLGMALQAAPLDDAIKIVRQWHQQCEQHSILYKMYLAKERANEQSA